MLAKLAVLLLLPLGQAGTRAGTPPETPVAPATDQVSAEHLSNLGAGLAAGPGGGAGGGSAPTTYAPLLSDNVTEYTESMVVTTTASTVSSRATPLRRKKKRKRRKRKEWRPPDDADGDADGNAGTATTAAPPATTPAALSALHSSSPTLLAPKATGKRRRKGKLEEMPDFSKAGTTPATKTLFPSWTKYYDLFGELARLYGAERYLDEGRRVPERPARRKKQRKVAGVASVHANATAPKANGQNSSRRKMPMSSSSTVPRIDSSLTEKKADSLERMGSVESADLEAPSTTTASSEEASQESTEEVVSVVPEHLRLRDDLQPFELAEVVNRDFDDLVLEDKEEMAELARDDDMESRQLDAEDAEEDKMMADEGSEEDAEDAAPDDAESSARYVSEHENPPEPSTRPNYTHEGMWAHPPADLGIDFIPLQTFTQVRPSRNTRRHAALPTPDLAGAGHLQQARRLLQVSAAVWTAAGRCCRQLSIFSPFTRFPLQLRRAALHNGDTLPIRYRNMTRGINGFSYSRDGWGNAGSAAMGRPPFNRHLPLQLLGSDVESGPGDSLARKQNDGPLKPGASRDLRCRARQGRAAAAVTTILVCPYGTSPSGPPPPLPSAVVADNGIEPRHAATPNKRAATDPYDHCSLLTFAQKEKSKHSIFNV